MPKKTLSYEDDLIARLQDRDYAVLYLKAALQDEDVEDEDISNAVFLLALRDVAKAHSIANVAQSAGLNRESLYRTLSEKGNPSLTSLKAVLKALGLRFSIESAETEAAIPVPVTQAEYSGTYSPKNYALGGEGACPISPAFRRIMDGQPASVGLHAETFEPKREWLDATEDIVVEASAA